ncbi:ABC-2 transporter permease [Virgibacillus chiguensis]|nr:ABC-2 transporter permease [Virgibacillus chiguensis]
MNKQETDYFLFLALYFGHICEVIKYYELLSSKMVIKEMGQMIILSASVALIFGTKSILLLLKFGAEKARMFLILGYVIPGALIIFMMGKLNELGVVLTEKMLNQTLMMLPVVVIIWLTLGYSFSVVIMNKKQY